MESSSSESNRTDIRDTGKEAGRKPTNIEEKGEDYRNWRMDAALKAAYKHPDECWRESDFRYDVGWNEFWSNTEKGRKC